ncbi:MAG: outer membrane lipoprotein carrier protein LolA [Alphaproteobacteria bacterium]|nr:outer membrane lipoprotein carrier protein LolA [Alphaproteobacteria bacterium]
MKKIILLFLILIFSTPSLALVDKRIDTPTNRQLLSKIETAYNKMRTLKANFAQFNSKMKEDLQTGTIYIKRPGQMRLVYEKGSPLEFVATNGYFVYHDKDLEEVNYFELSSTPVEWILRDKLLFDDEGFVVTDIQTILDEYFITAHKKDAKELGELTLVIDRDTLMLKQWDVLDMRGIKSTVSLFNIEQNISLDNKLFLFKNPYKKKD